MSRLLFSLKNIYENGIQKQDFISRFIIGYSIFVFIFPFKAYGIDPRWIIFIIYLALCRKDKFNPFLIRYRVLRVIKYPLLMALLSIVGIIINGTADFTFIYFPIQIIYLLILAFCIFKIFSHYYKKIDYYVITKYYISCLLIQSIIASAMFVNESFRDLMFDFQGFVVTERVLQMFLGVRLIGLGCFYFGAGVIYGLGLILLIPVMFKEQKKSKLVKLILIYLFLFAVGCFFARTCMIGLAVSALMIISCLIKPKVRHRAYQIINQFILWSSLIIISMVSIYMASPKLQEDYGKIIDFGFEAFINLSENGELSTKSSDGLQEEHLKILPDKINTYLLGDTQWMDGDHYYKGSDVGYIRLLFFFGIGGIVLFLSYQYSVLTTLCSIYNNPILNRCFKFIFLYVIILLVKGYTDVASLMFIYLFIENRTHKNENFVLS